MLQQSGSSDTAAAESDPDAQPASWFTFIETWVPAALLAAATILGLATVILRYFFGVGFVWAQGIIILLAILSALIASSGAVRTDEHLTFDLLIARLKGRSHRIARVAVSLVVTVLLGTLIVLNAQFIRFQISFGGTSVETGLPQWVPPVGVGVALVMMAVRYSQRLLRNIIGGGHK